MRKSVIFGALTALCLLCTPATPAQDADAVAKLKKENELLKKEVELLKKEIELLKKEAQPNGAKDGAKELEALQGTWNVDSMEWGGRSLPKELMTGYKFVFAGNKLTWDAAVAMQSRGGKISTIDPTFPPCDFKLDTGIDQKLIDITLQLKTGDRTLLGIYEIKGDTLKLSYNTGRRPTEFATKEGVNIGYIVMTRAKK